MTAGCERMHEQSDEIRQFLYIDLPTKHGDFFPCVEYDQRECNLPSDAGRFASKKAAFWSQFPQRLPPEASTERTLVMFESHLVGGFNP